MRPYYPTVHYHNAHHEGQPLQSEVPATTLRLQETSPDLGKVRHRFSSVAALLTPTNARIMPAVSRHLVFRDETDSNEEIASHRIPEVPRTVICTQSARSPRAGGVDRAAGSVDRVHINAYEPRPCGLAKGGPLTHAHARCAGRREPGFPCTRALRRMRTAPYTTVLRAGAVGKTRRHQEW